MAITKHKDFYFTSEPLQATPFDDLPSNQKACIEHLRLLISNHVHFTYQDIAKEFEVNHSVVRKLAIRHLDQPFKKPTAKAYIHDFIIEHGACPTAKQVQDNLIKPIKKKSILSAISTAKRDLNIEDESERILPRKDYFMSLNEIAGILNVSEETVRRVINSAMSKMKSYMESQGLNTDDFEFTTTVKDNIDER